MNILQVLPRLDEGGVETGTVDLARYLAANGHKAVVISEGGRLVDRLHEVGARHYKLPVGRKSIFALIGVVPRIVDVIRKENIQIIHARSRVPALSAFIASRIAHIHFITTAHGYYKRHLISGVMGWGKYVVVASNAMGYHMIKNFGVLQEKIKLIPRGVDLKRFEYKSPEERKNNPFVIAMISRISPIKGHAHFIQAVHQASRKIPNLKVIIIGGVAKGKEKYKKDLDLLVKRLGLSQTVTFLGPRQDIPEILKETNLLVLPPAEQEAFGRAVVEAQAAGVPVVASSVGGIVDIVKDGETGLLFSPGDVRELAEKIVMLAKDRKLELRLAENARRNVEENFSLEKMAALTLNLYEETLKTKSILVIKLSAVGDVILSIPSLRAIRNKFRGAKIKALVGIKSKDIFRGCPYVDDIIIYDYEARDKGLGGLLRKSSILRKMNFDISIDLQNNRRSHLLTAASLIPLRQGYHNKKFSFLLNRKVGEPKGPKDPVSHQANLLGVLGIPVEDKTLELWPSRSEEEWADKFLEDAWINKGQLLIGINPGASPKWNTKKWPVEKFAKLCDMLSNQLGARVLLTGTKEDKDTGDKLASLCKSRPINAIAKSTVMQLAALIKRCSVFITSDSAPMHIAAATGVNFLAIFGPTDPRRHLPSRSNCVVIKKDMMCSPCYKSRCIIGHKCMRNITVDEVFDAVKVLLKNKEVS